MTQKEPRFSFMEIGFAINPENSDYFFNSEQGMFMIHADTVNDNHRINIYVDMDIHKDVDNSLGQPGVTKNTVGLVYAEIGDLKDENSLMTLARLMLGIQNLDDEGYSFVLSNLVSALKRSNYDSESSVSIINKVVNYLLGEEVNVLMLGGESEKREKINDTEKQEIDKKINELENMLNKEQ